MLLILSFRCSAARGTLPSTDLRWCVGVGAWGAGYEQVMQQEGWHYELENKDDPLTYKGVVFNEMKGVYSSPDSLHNRACQQVRILVTGIGGRKCF